MATSILTYAMTHQGGPSRPFCRECTNSMTVKNCGALQCENPPPSVICVEPKAGEFEVGECASYPDCGMTLADTWLITISWPAMLEYAPGVIRTPSSAGSINLVGRLGFSSTGTGRRCSILGSFDSDIYPIMDQNGPLNREFTIEVELGTGIRGAIKNRFVGSPPNPTVSDGFRADGTDWSQLIDPNSGLGLRCNNYNQIGVLQLGISGQVAIDPMSQITITIYPFVNP